MCGWHMGISYSSWHSICIIFLTIHPMKFELTVGPNGFSESEPHVENYCKTITFTIIFKQITTLVQKFTASNKGCQHCCWHPGVYLSWSVMETNYYNLTRHDIMSKHTESKLPSSVTLDVVPTFSVWPFGWWIAPQSGSSGSVGYGFP
jgi:hypothetical protein